MNVKDLVSLHSAQMVEIRHHLHQNPELSNKEFETTALIRRHLEEWGIEVEEIGLKTGVCALIRGGKPGKTIAIREDIDALPLTEDTGLPFSSKVPGVAHACGHDIHASILLLCAKVLNEMKQTLSGNVRLLFQHAEETGNGALDLIAAGAMQREPKVDYVVGVHCSPDTPVGMVGVKKGAVRASFDLIDIKVKGIGGHGAHPYRCVDPIAAACYMVTQLQTVISRESPALDPAVFSVCAIHAGTAYNIIPTEVDLKGTLRSFSVVNRKNLQLAIQRVAQHSCEAMRATAEVQIQSGAPPLVNDSTTVDELTRAIEMALGAEKVFQTETASPGSDDFACLLEHAPGALLFVGSKNEDPATAIGLHNPKNVFDDGAIAAGAAALSQYVVTKLQGESCEAK